MTDIIMFILIVLMHLLGIVVGFNIGFRKGVKTVDEITDDELMQKWKKLNENRID